MQKVIRAALAAILATAVAVPAFGGTRNLSALPTSTLPKSKRVAVVYDENVVPFGASGMAAMSQALATSQGGVLGALTRQGIQVDYFSTAFFLANIDTTDNQYGTTLWRKLGDTYSLAIVYGGVVYGTATAGTANRTRFYDPDSTNVQLLILWSASNRNAMAGADTSTTAWPVSNQPRALTNAGSATCSYCQFSTKTWRMAYRPYGSTDTLWAGYTGTGIMLRGTFSNSGVDTANVVRQLEPLALSSLAPLNWADADADSQMFVVPASGDSTGQWYTVGNGYYDNRYDLLGPAWRVFKRTSGRYSENILSQGANTSYANTQASITYAIAARYLDVDPIKIAVEMDDVTDMGPDNQSATSIRWTNAGWDSLFTRWRDNYNCKPMPDVNPLHGYEYIRGDNPTYETVWVGDPWTWWKKWRIPWVHHSHDSKSSRPTSSLMGRYGGYATGNSNAVTIGGATTFTIYPRLAFRSYASQDSVYGPSIYKRLVYSDSLRRIVCPECPLPPYLSFPNNDALPINTILRTAPTGWMRYRWAGSTDSLCTVDSTYLAVARGLGIPSGGTLYLRGFPTDGSGAAQYVSWRPYGIYSPINSHIENDRYLNATADSVVASTAFELPGEERMVRDRSGVTDPAGGGQPYWIKVKNIGCVILDPGVGTNDAGTLAALSVTALGKLLGMNNGAVVPVTQGALDGSGNDFFGQAFSKDANGYYNASVLTQRNTGRDHPRIIYFHPGLYAGGANPTANPPVGPGENYATFMFARNILQPVNALNTLAGKRIIQWVQPWEVYQK